MAAVATASTERRLGTRVGPDASPWRAEAVLRPGLLVRLVNIGPRGALVESPGRLRPGRRAELQLCSRDSDSRQLICGRVERCHVVGLGPLSFHGAIAFDAAPGSTSGIGWSTHNG